MISEIAIAVTYIVSPLYSNLPRRRVDDFAFELNNLLKLKITPFWFPHQPFRGIHQRCFRVNGPYADPILYLAASKSGINQEELFNFLPKDELKIWIDPGEVTYQVGDQTSDIKCLFRYNSAIPDQSFPSTAVGQTVTTQHQSHFYLPKSLVPSFTVSQFAKTKFGSTKLKPNSALFIEPVRPNTLKLSPAAAQPDAIAGNNSNSNSLTYTPDSCLSGLLSPSCHQQVVGSPEPTALNIPCYLPWNVDPHTNGVYSNLLTINIPHYSSANGRESSGAGSLNSELNSPVHGY